MRNQRSVSTVVYGVLYAGVVVFKMWLVYDQPLAAGGAAQHDDLLFIRLAYSILKGQWLGPYDIFTLVKGPGYPLWVAMNYMLGLPLLVGQHLFYLVACALVLMALRPLLQSRALLFILFLLLWFTPTMYCTAMTRAMRDSVYTSTVLIVHACLCAVLLWRRWSNCALAGWFAGLGLTLAFAYITREEGVWLAPGVGIALLAAICFLWNASVSDRSRWLRIAPLAPALAISIVGGVSLLNYCNYGMFGIAEQKSGPFLRAYGALTRVNGDKWKPNVVVPSDVRKAIYAVSPSFAELQSYFEGSGGKIWVSHGPGDPDGEIKTGWFLWGLRDAVGSVGHCHSAREALAYYGKLADEVNGACDKHILPCGPYRASLASPWRWEYVPLCEESFVRMVKLLVCYEQIAFGESNSSGTPDQIELFRRLTRSRLAPAVDFPEDPIASSARFPVKPQIMEYIAKLYRGGAPVGAVAGLGGFAAALILSVRRRRSSPLFVLGVVFVASVFTRLAVLSYVDAALFPSLFGIYMAPAYPLFLLVCVLAPCACIYEFRNPPARASLDSTGAPVAEVEDEKKEAAAGPA